MTRRIPIREERSDGWRTRVVDNLTESEVNVATSPVDKTIYDGLVELVMIIKWFLSPQYPSQIMETRYEQSVPTLTYLTASPSILLGVFPICWIHVAGSAPWPAFWCD